MKKSERQILYMNAYIWNLERQYRWSYMQGSIGDTDIKNRLFELSERCQSVSSVTQSCLTLCDPVNCSTPGLLVHHQLLESTQTHVHCVGDAIQPSHPLSYPSPPVPSPSQHQGLFQWANSSHEVAKVLKSQLQHHPSNEHPRLISFRMDLLAVQGTLKSLLQHHGSKASILWCSAFFTVQHDHWKNHSLD